MSQTWCQQSIIEQVLPEKLDEKTERAVEVEMAMSVFAVRAN